jgi:hypothetical protein
VPGEKNEKCRSLAVCKGRLISRHRSGLMHVWNVVTGARERVIAGHTQTVIAWATCGSFLVSGSFVREGNLKVWTTGAAERWTCKRTLLGHKGCV